MAPSGVIKHGHTWPWKIQENPPINGGFNGHGPRGISNSAGDAKLDDPLGTIPRDTLGGPLGGGK